MKKIFFITFFLAVTAVLYAQYAPSVLGIHFGSSYETVKTALEERVGKYKVCEEGGDLKVYGITIGDFHFDLGAFSFQRKGSNTYFNSANFIAIYPLDEISVVKSYRDRLYKTIKSKYEDEYLEVYTNEEGFRCYKFGLDPMDTDKVLGLIHVFKSTSKVGGKQVCLTLSYGPIYYVDKATDF